MIKHITFTDFCDSFSYTYKNNFSYEGKRALFDHFEEYERSTDEQIELDPIAFCCDYTEYDNFADLQNAYPDIKSMDELEDKTTVILIEGTERFIILNF